MPESGVPNLDLVLGGGIPARDILLLIGQAGSGKTTLSFQVAFHAAAGGQNVVYVFTTSEPATRLLRHIRSFSFYDESQIGKRLFLLGIYPLVRESLETVVSALARSVQEHEARLVIVDGLMTIRDLHPEAREFRSFIYDLGATLAALDCTTVLTSSGMTEAATQFPEFTMSDGVVELAMQDVGSQTVRTLRVSKMRGLAPLLGRHSFRIDRQGITVFPRIESLFRQVDLGLSTARVSTGLPEVDAMAEGGLIAGSMTVLAGSMGTGKTLAGLHFLAAGAQRGEKGLFVGFRETPRHLVDRARGFGLDLESAIAEGQVAIVHCPPVDLVLDEVTWRLKCELDRLAPQRLVLDSIADLEPAIIDARHQRGFMAALAGVLRNRAVTSLIMKEIPQIVGPELDFSDTPLAALAENVLLFRYVEFRGELYRILSLLKMRDSAHDRSIRQYSISTQGFRVLSRVETAEGVLTGIARLPSEQRVKRRASRLEEGL